MPPRGSRREEDLGKMMVVDKKYPLKKNECDLCSEKIEIDPLTDGEHHLLLLTIRGQDRVVCPSCIMEMAHVWLAGAHKFSRNPGRWISFLDLLMHTPLPGSGTIVLKNETMAEMKEIQAQATRHNPTGFASIAVKPNHYNCIASITLVRGGTFWTGIWHDRLNVIRALIAGFRQVHHCLWRFEQSQSFKPGDEVRLERNPSDDNVLHTMRLVCADEVIGFCAFPGRDHIYKSVPEEIEAFEKGCIRALEVIELK